MEVEDCPRSQVCSQSLLALPDFRYGIKNEALADQSRKIKKGPTCKHTAAAISCGKPSLDDSNGCASDFVHLLSE